MKGNGFCCPTVVGEGTSWRIQEGMAEKYKDNELSALIIFITILIKLALSPPFCPVGIITVNMFGHINVVNILLDREADIETEDK